VKNVLCTGIAGFLGQNLSRELMLQGWKVYGIDDFSVGREDWLPDGVICLDQNICDPITNTTEYDLIIHLASRKIPREGDSQIVLTENTDGLKNILNYAMFINSKFLYLSTSDIYGKNTSFSEESDSVIGQPNIQRWSYAISKMWGEQLLYSTPERFDFNIIRLFGTYGPYQALSWTAGPQSVFISQALKQEPITIHGHGNQMRAFQFIDDAIDGIMNVVNSDYTREIFNIGNPNEPIEINSLAKMVWGIVNNGDEIKVKHIPHSVFKYEEVPFRTPDITKARTLLGFEPKITLLEGLEETIRWQRGVV